MPPAEFSEEQVLWFRARRGHLAGPGAPDVAAAARAILGGQAQQLPPALLSLSLRTRGRPTADAVRARLLEPPRTLVHTWGQRDTLHLYHASADWPLVVAAKAEWAGGGRRDAMPSAALVAKTLRAIERRDGEPATRGDLLEIPAGAFLEAAAEKIRAVGMSMDPKRFAAGRLLWVLANRGDTCLAGKLGNEQAHALRAAWFPDLEWHPPDPRTAATELARRYLATYGPATAQDLAHFFGARVGVAKAWIEALGDGLVQVRCGDREGLFVARGDLRDLRAEPPAGASDWPLRLLPLWDAMTMGHADKSWTVPDEAERKREWRKAGHIPGTVVARGRIVARWSSKVRRQRLEVTVEPLAGWRPSRHLAGARREAREIARHLGLEGSQVTDRG